MSCCCLSWRVYVVFCFCDCVGVVLHPLWLYLFVFPLRYRLLGNVSFVGWFCSMLSSSFMACTQDADSFVKEAKWLDHPKAFLKNMFNFCILHVQVFFLVFWFLLFFLQTKMIIYTVKDRSAKAPTNRTNRTARTARDPRAVPWRGSVDLAGGWPWGKQ